VDGKPIMHKAVDIMDMYYVVLLEPKQIAKEKPLIPFKISESTIVADHFHVFLEILSIYRIFYREVSMYNLYILYRFCI
jgi:hypothetical protein